MTTKNVNRRQLLIGMAGGAAIIGVSACSKEVGLKCATPDLLSTGEKAARDGRKYTEASKVEGQSCLNCEFFQSTEAACGTCAIDSLPANPAGHCTSWSAIEEARLNKNAKVRKA